MKPIDRYLDVLGVKRGVSKDELKSAYRALIRVTHPDRVNADGALKKKAEDRTKLLNEAYAYLSENFDQTAPSEPVDAEIIPPVRARSEEEKKRQDAEYQKRKALREAAEALRVRQENQRRYDQQTRWLGIAFVVLLLLYLSYMWNHPFKNPGWDEAPAVSAEDDA